MALSNGKIEELYSRFTEGFLTDLQSDEFFAFFLNALKSNQANVSLYEKYLERNVDIRWVEMIENAIIPLDTIIRTPMRYIKNEEEIVPIEMIRSVTTESIRHLAQHTNMIAMVKGDEVTPQRMLNIVKEESFETYENRFIYTLLQKLEYFLDKRLQTLLHTSDDSQDLLEMKLNGQCDAGQDVFTYNMEISCLTPHAELSEEDLNLNADTSKLNAMQRIERVRRILYDFKGSSLIKSLHGCALVRPPLNMTNVLTKNQNFRKAVDLWMFVEQYDEVGYTVNRVEREAIPSEGYMHEMFSMLALQYVVMKRNSGRTDVLADFSERKNELTPNIIRKDIDEIIEDYDLEIDEVKRIFLERLDRKKKKQQTQYNKVRDMLTRAMDAEEKKLELEAKRRQEKLDRIAREEEKRRKAAEEAERLRREAEEAERRRIEAEEAERRRLEEEEAERLRREAEEAERLRLEAEEAERRRLEEEEAERLRLEAEEAERLRREAEEAERRRLEEEEAERLRLEAEEAERARREADLLERQRIADEYLRRKAEERLRREAEEAEYRRLEDERQRLAAEEAERRIVQQRLEEEKAAKKLDKNKRGLFAKGKKNAGNTKTIEVAAPVAPATPPKPYTPPVKPPKKEYDGSRKKKRNKHRIQKRMMENAQRQNEDKTQS